MLPARIKNGALTGMWKVRYCDSWSRCRSERTWKEVFGGENSPDIRRMLGIIVGKFVCVDEEMIVPHLCG